MDMRFYWLRDRVRQKQFHVHWKKGLLNLGDYVTKHHPTKHHMHVRPTYVANKIISSDSACNQLQICPQGKSTPTSQILFPNLNTQSCKGVLNSYLTRVFTPTAKPTAIEQQRSSRQKTPGQHTFKFERYHQRTTNVQNKTHLLGA